jgi:predicted acetyltransferase
MESLLLVTPTKDHERAALEYRQEHFDNGEMLLHGSSLFDIIESYNLWLDHLKANASPATVQEGWVVSSTFFGIRESDGRIVGMIDIRHTLNDFLRNNGGHIGYGVRPSERFKGYATRMLELALEKCRQLGLERVMLACEKENTASRKTIMKCGGGLEREFEHSDGKTVQVFWITI